MRRSNKRNLALAAGLSISTLCAAQTASPAPASTAVWRNGVLEVQPEDGAPWAQAIPFTLLASSPSWAVRFHKSQIDAQTRMHPEGPIRAAKATLHKRIWLQWGQGKTPLAVEGWPYRLLEQKADDGNTSYLWANAHLSKKVKTSPGKVQSVRHDGATWCTWFAVQGERVSNPHLADGPTPTIHWMLWRRPSGSACR